MVNYNVAFVIQAARQPSFKHGIHPEHNHVTFAYKLFLLGAGGCHLFIFSTLLSLPVVTVQLTASVILEVFSLQHIETIFLPQINKELLLSKRAEPELCNLLEKFYYLLLFMLP